MCLVAITLAYFGYVLENNTVISATISPTAQIGPGRYDVPGLRAAEHGFAPFATQASRLERMNDTGSSSKVSAGTQWLGRLRTDFSICMHQSQADGSLLATLLDRLKLVVHFSRTLGQHTFCSTEYIGSKLSWQTAKL